VRGKALPPAPIVAAEVVERHAPTAQPTSHPTTGAIALHLVAKGIVAAPGSP